MSYSHSAIPFLPVSAGFPVLLQAPPFYSGTATYGGQTASIDTPSGR